MAAYTQHLKQKIAKQIDTEKKKRAVSDVAKAVKAQVLKQLGNLEKRRAKLEAQHKALPKTGGRITKSFKEDLAKQRAQLTTKASKIAAARKAPKARSLDGAAKSRVVQGARGGSYIQDATGKKRYVGKKATSAKGKRDLTAAQLKAIFAKFGKLGKSKAGKKSKRDDEK